MPLPPPRLPSLRHTPNSAKSLESNKIYPPHTTLSVAFVPPPAAFAAPQGFLHEEDVRGCGTMTEEQWVDALTAEIDDLAGHIEVRPFGT
ncbi:hypothetical protein EDB84DRAFT_1567205 [Lactarius hengduanensis]|nr:hypothetical protein EDB84DRAFT_1567205 [Lactarius hengduanensis]